MYKTIINNFAASALLAKQHEHEAKKRRKKHKKKDEKKEKGRTVRQGQADTLQLGAKQKQPQATTAATRAAAGATGATIILDSHSTQGARS